MLLLLVLSCALPWESTGTTPGDPCDGDGDLRCTTDGDLLECLDGEWAAAEDCGCDDGVPTCG